MNIDKDGMVKSILPVICLFISGFVSAENSSLQDESQVASQEKRRNSSTIVSSQDTSDISNQVIFDTARKDPFFQTPRFDAAVTPWYDWKDALFERRGLQFSLSYTALGQHATETRPGNNDNAIGGAADFTGTWALFRRDTDWKGMLGFRIGDQDRLRTSETPNGLGDQIGSSWGTALSFGDISLNAIEGWWEQRLGSKLAFRIGKLDSSSVFDPSAVGNPYENFLGHPFTLNNTIAYPDEGLGVIGHLMFTDELSLVLGVVDANGDGSDWNFDDFFFDEREHLRLAELAWEPRMSFGEGDYSITVWDSDKRQEAQVRAGDGYTIHAEQRIGNIMPFFRYGHSSGRAAGLKNMIATGAGFYHPFGNYSDGIGLGFSWGEPFGDNPRDQYGIEAYYRIQLTNEIAITPDIQYIIDPSNNPDEDSLVVFSLRLRTAF